MFLFPRESLVLEEEITVDLLELYNIADKFVDCCYSLLALSGADTGVKLLFLEELFLVFEVLVVGEDLGEFPGEFDVLMFQLFDLVLVN